MHFPSGHEIVMHTGQDEALGDVCLPLVVQNDQVSFASRASYADYCDSGVACIGRPT
jgi:hypothetical protein